MYPRLLCCLFLIYCSTLAHAGVIGLKKSKPKIAIIIDDLGYKLQEGELSIGLAFPITLAIIPSSPHARKFAEAANCREDKEILVHMPMTPGGDVRWEEGLNENMDQEEFTQAAEKLLARVPHAIGVNNHGGSQLTQDRERMDWLMAILERRRLFFVDSRTSPASVAAKAAAAARIPFSSRDVFLDNDRNPEAISAQLDKLVAVAMKQGQAIGIGHPHKETLSVLQERLDELQKQGFEFVGISELLHQNQDFAVSNRPLLEAEAL